ncbi:hypothetical protein TVAG_321080 [Trichomonas vaginalis G3]|uniref:Glycosyltransferase 61 catalytic domain-containing protein n=1 Tax=Trichomonas vaginalis (strain ATCC PRA-98 / G3) TaxID=412133 RepID=A2F816_TRIV3|nr:glycosyltransferase family [Trichomonas vaginalis G3]EAX98948.1 hypothetical protein TVAG_321080 [Trichomonas vaginalis G3]KAI5533486.1 glycosyltransferase family [Trichomonas vaginalis G3]|eukprot:XP_001311878.1 hypothetical protein [Trichomonas vaginalis G3]
MPACHYKKFIRYNETIPIDHNGLIIDCTVPNNFSLNEPTLLNYNNTKSVINYSKTLVATFAHLQNLYVCSSILFANESDVFIKEKKFIPAFTYDYDQERIFLGVYEHVVAVGHWWSSEYGHFFIDCLCPLMCVPQEYWSKSTIVIGKRHSDTYNFLILHDIGFPDERILMLNESQWIFAKNIYTVFDPPTYFRHPATAFRNLSKLLFKNFNLKQLPATRYVMYNRAKESKRRIGNFENLTKTAKLTFPEIKWEIITDEFASLKEAAISHTGILFLYTITGTNLIRILFMPKGSVVVTTQLNWNEFSFQSLALSLGIKYFTYSTPDYDHYTFDPIMLNLTHTMRAIKIGLYAAQHGQFPAPSKEYPYKIY